MANMTIDEVTPDTSITGVEKLAASDAGQPRSISTAVLRDYVISALASITSVSETTLSDDKVYIQDATSSAMRMISGDAFADAVAAQMLGKEDVNTIAATDVISIKRGDALKTASMSQIYDYVVGLIGTTDIHSLTEAGSVADENLFVIERQNSDSTWSKLKLLASNLASYVIGKIRGSAAGSTTALADSDEIMAFVGSDHALKRVSLSDSGIGKGTTIAPSTTTENNIPQWDSTSKTLKDGLTLEASITSTSPSTGVPTAAAVYDAVNAVDAKTVDGPAENNDGYIPQWNGASSKTLKNGLAVTTSISNTDNASDAKVPTEKAVRAAISGLSFGDVVAPSTNTDSKIPQWDGVDSKTLKDGLAVTTTVAGTTTAVDAKVPTEKAVRTAINNCVEKPVNTTLPQSSKYIPFWSETTQGDTPTRLSLGRKLYEGIEPWNESTSILDADGVNLMISKLSEDIINRCVVTIASSSQLPSYIVAYPEVRLFICTNEHALYVKATYNSTTTWHKFTGEAYTPSAS